jgi:hypothetical protein
VEPSSIQGSGTDEITDDGLPLSRAITSTPEEGESEEALSSLLSSDHECSIVQFCKHPDTKLLTCIRQPGCTCAAARSECFREAYNRCGNVAGWPYRIPGC